MMQPMQVETQQRASLKSKYQVNIIELHLYIALKIVRFSSKKAIRRCYSLEISSCNIVISSCNNGSDKFNGARTFLFLIFDILYKMQI